MRNVGALIAALGGVLLTLSFILERKRKKHENKEKHNTVTQMPIVLVVDMGSSSVRCSAFKIPHTHNPTTTNADNTANGATTGSVQPMGIVTTQRDRVVDRYGFADADAVLRAVENVVKKCVAVLEKRDQARNVSWLGFASFSMAWLGVDENGQAVTPVLTYANSHPSTQQYIKTLSTKINGNAFQGTGVRLHTSYAPAQLLRLKEEDPTVFARVHKWQTLSSYIISRWTNQPFSPVGTSEAAWTGLLDVQTCNWSSSLTALLGLSPDTLPPISDALPLPTRVTSPLFSTCSPTFSLVIGVADGFAANVGSGCVDSTHIAVTVGTSAAARVLLSVPKGELLCVPDGLWCYRVDSRHVLVGGALTDGGSVLQWLRQTLRLSDQEISEALSCYSPQHGVVVLPFFNGERAPGWHSNATATFSGITWNTTPAQIVGATVESVSLRLAEIIRLLAPLAASNAVLVGSGAALDHSRPWRQMIADITSKTIGLCAHDEITSLGVAVLVAQSLSFGQAGAHGPSIDPDSILQPRPALFSVYQDAIKAQAAVYDALLPSS